VGEIQPGACPDLDHPPREPGEELVTMIAGSFTLRLGGDAPVHAGEDRMMDPGAHLGSSTIQMNT
jgi:hypothetical protein